MTVSTAQVTPRCEDFPSFHDVVFAYLTDTVTWNATSYTCYSSFTK